MILFVGLQTMTAQAKAISGKVVDNLGEAIPGVSIIVKGTTTGTITRPDGTYMLNVPKDNTVLIFTFVGMKMQEVLVGEKTSIDVVLQPDVFGMDEIIVSGVASNTPRKKLAVSVAKVSSEDLAQVPSGSASGALQGKVAGVSVISSTGEPGSSASIQIRGATQIAGSQDPLIIVDGAISEGSLGDINVDDIESMEVVKGASASALYGSRAGNGVIVITTKRGKGLAAGESVVTVRNEFGFNALAKKYDLATHHQYELADDYEDYETYTKYEGVTYDDDYSGGWDGISGDRSESDDQYMDNPYGLTHDHEGDFFDGGVFYTNYVSVANRSEKTNFLASFENYDQGGIVVLTDGYQRNSFRLNVDHQLSDKISISASNLYVKTTTQDPGGNSYYNGGVFFDLLLTQPDVNLHQENEDGQPYLYLPDPWASTTTNPLYDLWKIEDETERNRFMGSYSAKWNITNDLNLESKYAFEVQNINNTQYSPYDTYTLSGDEAVYSEGYYYKYNSKLNTENVQTTLNYSKKIGDFNIRNKASFLYEEEKYESYSATGYDFTISGMPTFDAIGGEYSVTSYQEEIISQNFFEIFYLDYKDKYIFDGMFRYDGSSLFGENERWKPYYRVSGAWRISEDFKIAGIQELKLRSAYGTSGQRPHLFDMQYEVYSLDDGVASIEQVGNKDLKPSLSKEFEVGLNVDFLDKFSAEFVYSKTSTEDQFVEALTGAQFGGYDHQWVNAGTMESKVFEASLGYNVVRKKDLNWMVNITFDKHKTKITELDIDPYLTGPQGQDADLFYIAEGETFGTMYGYSFVRTFDQLEAQLGDGESVDDYVMNSDGYIIEKGTEGTSSEAAIKREDGEGSDLFSKIGDATPDFNFNFTSNLSYKGFALYMLCSWQKGGDIYNKSAQWLTRDNRHGMMDMYGVASEKKKTVNYYQSLYDTNNLNEFWVEDASYFKLREVSLSYTVPKGVLSGMANGFIKNAKFSVSGRNLLTISDYSGYDPEVQTGDDEGTQQYSYDFMGYPNYRSFSASLELKF
jgi:TonB-linked SusC/RagA family outer membrane protein